MRMLFSTSKSLPPQSFLISGTKLPCTNGSVCYKVTHIRP
ncbi:hypothetical protein APHDU1_0973 [Anaplasma phagocytophilum]|nr:hypothetical protein APHDU1_0973 [Anaplasma phagocytophilum]